MIPLTLPLTIKKSMKVKKDHKLYLLRFWFVFKYFFLSKKTLKSLFSKELRPFLGSNRIQFHLNGRSAIFQIATHLKQTKSVRTVILPYRICNVVELAFHKAGYEIEWYKREQEIERIRRLYAEKPVIVVFASTPFSPWSKRANRFPLTETQPTYVLYDECQVLGIQSFRYLSNLEDHEFVVYSLNNKVVPGQMGAFSCCAEVHSFNSEVGSWTSSLRLMYLDVFQTLRFFRDQPAAKGEFSHCKPGRYEISEKDISKYSLLLGLGYIKKLDFLWLRIKSNIEACNALDDDAPKRYTREPHIYLKLSNKGPYDGIVKGPYLKTPTEGLEEALKDYGAYAVDLRPHYKYS